MSHPRSLSEKLTRYATDNFDVWLRKTNITSREQGDLNHLDETILSRMMDKRYIAENCNHTKNEVNQDELNKFTFTGLNGFSVDDEVMVGVQFRLVKSVTEPTPGTFVIAVDAPFNPPLSDSTVINVTSINLVKAVNESFEENRRTLIKAIAMS